LNVPVLAGSDFGRSWGDLEEIQTSQIDSESIKRSTLLSESAPQS
jgi:hypothetical protein